MALASTLLLSACTPACTPDARAPEAGQSGQGQGQGARKSIEPPAPGEMIMEAKGVDLAQLKDAQRSAFFQVLNTEPSACDKPHSLATSLRDDSKCRDSLIVAQFIADRLATGATPSDVKADIEIVIDSLQPVEINIKGRPVWGDPRAPVTVVMFADFECPHCRAEAPALRKAVDQFHRRAKLVFKHFPLQMHVRAKVAAIAVEAAHEQGKFWEMHDIVFGHQTQLEDADLYRYARQIGLDMNKFTESFKAQRGKSRVEEDRSDGERIDISGTPAVFVDGRYVNDLLFGGTVTGWIDDALKR